MQHNWDSNDDDRLSFARTEATTVFLQFIRTRRRCVATAGTVMRHVSGIASAFSGQGPFGTTNVIVDQGTAAFAMFQHVLRVAFAFPTVGPKGAIAVCIWLGRRWLGADSDNYHYHPEQESYRR